MLFLPCRIEHALGVSVQGPHDADTRGSAAIGDERERLDRGLPFRQRGFFFWKASNVCRRVAQRAQLFALGEDDRIVEFA